MALEEEHFAYHRQREVDELEELLADLGLHGEVLQAATAQLAENDESMLKVMMALEFGALEKERRSPWKAMIASGALFLVGALPSVIPFFFVTEPRTGLIWAAILAGIGLFAVGWVKSVVTRAIRSALGLENFRGGRRGCRCQLPGGQPLRSGGVRQRRKSEVGRRKIGSSIDGASPTRNR